MNKKYLLSIIMLLLFGCATNTYNIPFVDSVETVMLTSGMSRSDVLSEMGQKPLYSEYGNEGSGEIFWVYEIRGREVKSDLLPTSALIPNKDHNITRPTKPIHRLRLEFRDDKLYRWHPLVDISNTEQESEEEVSDLSSSTPKDTIYVLVSKDGYNGFNKKFNKNIELSYKKSFFIQPQICRYSLEYTKDITSMSQPNGTGEKMKGQIYLSYPGLYFGIYNSFGRVGFELGFREEGGMLMLRHEKLGITSLDLNINVGVGFITYNLADNISDLDPDSHHSLGFFKFGIGKDFSILGSQKLIPKFEFIVGEATYKGVSLSYQF